MGLIFNKTYKGGSVKRTITPTKAVKQLTPLNIQFLKQLGFKVKTK
jgi:hypothetical protein